MFISDAQLAANLANTCQALVNSTAKEQNTTAEIVKVRTPWLIYWLTKWLIGLYE